MILSKRRLSQVGIVLFAGFFILLLFSVASASLRSTSFLTGWLLFIVVIFLALYNGRKKLPFLPLGSSALWLNLHLYGGWLAFFLFALHLYPRGAQSLFGMILAGLFLLVALSGVVGIVLSRNFAGRLTTRGGEVIYERIPILRKEIREKAEELAIRSIHEADTQTIGQFYTQRLQPFLSGPKHFFRHLVESGAPWAKLQADMKGLERYLNDTEMEILNQLKELLRAKDDLDYHFALQSVLKYWLFVHIPVTFALLLFTFVHIALVQFFFG
jgi:hypothetical protein